MYFHGKQNSVYIEIHNYVPLKWQVSLTAVKQYVAHTYIKMLYAEKQMSTQLQKSINRMKQKNLSGYSRLQ